MKITGPTSTVDHARRLRRTMSLPEVLLWQRLRRSVGPRFRRQHPAGPYILDFSCAQAGLVVEVGGIAHAMGSAVRDDARRDAFLQGLGLRVVRIPATEVLADADRVAGRVIALAADPLHHRKGDGPPPPGTGEEFRSL